MTAPAVLEVRRRPAAADVRSVVQPTLLLVVALGFLVSSAVAIATQRLTWTGVVSALFVVGFAVATGVRQGRRIWALRSRLSRRVVLRLDDDGVTIAERRLPWHQVAACTLTQLSPDDGLLSAPHELVRFVARDDRDLPGPTGATVTTAMSRLAAFAALTPHQAAWALLLHGTGRTDPIAAWCAERRPTTPVVRGTATPWVTWTTPNPWPDEPRVAVVGGNGRTARLVLESLVAQGQHPVAVVRNEAHRHDLESAGAEVRMLDVDVQDENACVIALRHTTTVLFLAGSDDDEVARRLAHEAMPKVARAAARMLVRRFVWVADTAVLPPPQAGSGGSDQPARLAWTALRVRRLVDTAPGDAAGVVIGPDVEAGDVSRRDLADIVVAALDDPSTFERDLAVGPRTLEP